MVGMSTCDKTREQLNFIDRKRVIPCMLDKEVIVNGVTIPVCEIENLDITTFPQWMKEDNTPISSGLKSVGEIKKLNKELYMKASNVTASKVEVHWEIRIISFQQKLPLLKKFRDMFPDVPSRIQRAVNVKGVPIYKLYESNLISMSSYMSMTQGRKYHREVNSLGAVGLAQANRIALLDNDSNNNTHILLCEDDCEIQGQDKFQSEISTLLGHTHSFDLAVFGGSIYNKDFSSVTVSELEAVPFMDDGWYYLDAKYDFFYTHCVFFTSRGRKIVGEYLMNERLEMQIDGLYSSMSRLNLIKVVIQLSKSTANQSLHFSSIQNHKCRLCSMAP